MRHHSFKADFADRRREGQCERKKRFNTKAKAIRHTASRKLTVYKCPFCLGWHHSHWGRGGVLNTLKGLKT